MTAPLCLRQGCRNQVKPVDRHRSAWGPYRLIDGQHWRNTCSRACSRARATAKQRARPEALEAFLANNRDAYRSRVKQRLHDEALPIAERYGIPVGELVRALWQAEARGYHRGFNAARARIRRKALA